MKKNEQNKGIFNVLSRFGLALTTLEDAPIGLNALIIENMFGTQADIVYVLTQQYGKRFAYNLFKLLGSTSLLGNPVSLVNNLGSGVKDFFYKPFEGFVQGPLEGGYGLVEGTSSLLASTVAGTFGSASAIAGTLSSSILAFAGDNEYNSRREEAKV